MSTLKVQIGANISQLEKALSTAQSRLERFGSSMTNIGRTLSTRVSAPLSALGGLSVKTAADFETLQQSMNVLNGSVEEGTRNFERLKRFSAGTPFQLQDLASAQNMLQGFGLAADEAFQSLSMIGDIAAITGGDINGIGIAFGQAAAEGKLFTRDIRQLINQGVPAIKLLADTMGVAQSEVLSLAEEGQISFEILQKAFRDATSEGGMFADGMEQQANTINGVFSTLKDNVSIALAELGTVIVDTLDLKQVVKDITTAVQNITQNFANMSEESQKKILKMAGLLIASGPLAIAIGQMAKFVVLLSTVVRTSFFKMAAPVIAFIALLNETSKVLAKYTPQFRAALLVGAEKAKQSIKDLVGVMGDWALETFGVKDALSELTTALDEGDTALDDFGGGAGGGTNPITEFATAIQRARPVIEGELFAIGEVMRQSTRTVETSANRWPEVIREAMQKTQEVMMAITQVIRQGITDMAIDFSAAMGEVIAGTSTLDQAFVGVLKNLAEMAVKIGKIILASGLGIEKLKLGLASFTGIGAIAAGSALIALGTAAKSALSSASRGGAGGSVDQFQRSATSVPSANQGGTVEFRIGNNALVGVLQQGSKRDSRVGKRVGLQ